MISTIVDQTLSPSYSKGDLVTVLKDEKPKYIAIYGGKDSANRERFFPLHSFNPEMSAYRGIEQTSTVSKTTIGGFNSILRIESRLDDKPFNNKVYTVTDIDGKDYYYAIWIKPGYNDTVLVTPIKLIAEANHSPVGGQEYVHRSRCIPFEGLIELSNHSL